MLYNLLGKDLEIICIQKTSSQGVFEIEALHIFEELQLPKIFYYQAPSYFGIERPDEEHVSDLFEAQNWYQKQLAYFLETSIYYRELLDQYKTGPSK